MDISYSIDNGVNWETVVNDADASKEQFAWLIPDTESAECLIKISEVSDPFLNDTSDVVWQITGTFISITSPKGGESLECESTFNITWEATQSIVEVYIDFTTDNGESWVEIVHGIRASNGSYTWAVPVIETSTCRVRIKNKSDSEVYAFSEGTFTIEPPSSWEGWWTRWDNYDGLMSGVPNVITCDAGNGVWIGFYEGASYYNGSVWMNFIPQIGQPGIPEAYVEEIAVDNEGIAWFGTEFGKLFSFDGTTWTTYDESPTNIRNILIDNNNVKWLGSRGQGLIRYDGSSWTTFSISNSGLTNNDSEVIALDLDNSLWIGYRYASKGVSHFNGITWTHYLAGENVYDIAVDSKGVKWFATSNGLSRFDGTTWTTFTTLDGLPGNIVPSVIVDNDDVIWAGTTTRIARYDGESWLRLNQLGSSSLDEVHGYVKDIAVDSNNTKWFLVGGSGIVKYTPYASDTPTLVESRNADIVPQEITITGNFPNPFNPETTIEFTLPKVSHVTADIYNLAGQKVETVADARFPTGRHTLVWNASNHAAGLYFCRIESGDHIQTVKMMFVK
ncbi:hypothetical protein ES708_24857 [subsurface metagenome]